MNNNKKSTCAIGERLGTVGGQAVLEGVMMKAKNRIALTVRDVDGNLKTEVKTVKPLAQKYPIFKLPIIRGIGGFVESMIQSFGTLNRSAELLGIEEEEQPSKFEIWLEKTFGKSLVAVASVIGAVLGVLLSVGLFIYLPKLLSDVAINPFTENPNPFLKSALQGILRIGIFVGYIAVVSLLPDIKRTFMYHGAEHKSIFCHESGAELTVENVRKQSRFHPRCGTSFMFVMMILGIFVSTFYANVSGWLYTLLKILTLPIVVGVGYEFIKYAGKHDNLFVRICSAPGLWMQNLTTKEPDDGMIEVAISSLKLALPDIYPTEEKEEQPQESSEQVSEQPIEQESEPVKNEQEKSDVLEQEISADNGEEK